MIKIWGNDESLKYLLDMSKGSAYDKEKQINLAPGAIFKMKGNAG
jgi:hypothetical protein